MFLEGYFIGTISYNKEGSIYFVACSDDDIQLFDKADQSSYVDKVMMCVVCYGVAHYLCINSRVLYLCGETVYFFCLFGGVVAVCYDFAV